VVSDLTEEALRASESIEAILNGVALSAWKTFKVCSPKVRYLGSDGEGSFRVFQEGYLTFHISQDRYRLSDISQALQPMARPVVLKAAEEGVDNGLHVHGCMIVALALITSSLTYFLV